MNKYRHTSGYVQDHNIATALLLQQNVRQSMLNTSSNIGKDKSFAYDLNKERGIVSMRVASVPRSAEIQPLFWRFVSFPSPSQNQSEGLKESKRALYLV